MPEAVPEQKASDVARRRALVKASPGLQVYGTFEEVQELVRRFKVMCPETKDMTPDEIVAFAQVAYAHGLNPLPAVREIVWIPGKGPMVAIRGWRRKGREWADEHELGLPDLRYELITDAVEREKFEIPEGAMAYRCIGGFPVARAKYVQDAVTLREALGKDAPYQVILDTMGPMPVTVGIGYLTAEEMERKDEPKWWHKCKTNNGKNTPLFGMEPCPACGEKSYAQPPAYGHAQHAMKRAEAHWWKQAADLPFAITPSGEGAADLDDVPITLEGTWKDVTPDALKGMAPEQIEQYVEQVQQAETHATEQAAKTPEERKADAKAGSDALFGDDPEPRMWPDHVVALAEKAWKANGVLPPDTHTKHVVMLLNLSPFQPAEVTDAQLISWGKVYRGFRDEDLGSKQAAAKATVEFAKTQVPF
jgi:hypothetical protein